MKLSRPLVFFDLETTGVDPNVDRIVEFCLQRHEPDGSTSTLTRRVNPERPIPESATAVHGIHDADVADEPTFAELADELLTFLGDGDLGGFNVQRFDGPLLERECADCGRDLRLDERQVIDAMTIYHRKERRDLSAAALFYLDREHSDAHAAEADVTMTADILIAQLERYEDVPNDVDELATWLRGDSLDLHGKFAWKEGEVVFNFGKHRGNRLREVAKKDANYCRWFLDADFRGDAKELVSQALDGKLPSR